MGRLPLGKIPIDLLSATVLRLTGAPSKRVATPPKAGLDFAAIAEGGEFLIVSADPVTGVTDDIGTYAVNVSANDVATSGSRPRYAETVIMLPKGSGPGDVKRIAGQIDRTCRRLGITVVGGHTEVTEGINRPIVAVTAFGFAKKYVSSQDAQSGDTIMMTKTAGLEGTAAIAGGWSARGGNVPVSVLKTARTFVGKLSIIDEAVAAFKTGEVNAMHDCTEGGVLGAVYEMSLASGVGFKVKESSVPVAPETKAICRELSLDPLRLIGSGSLLLSVKKGKEDKVKRALATICRLTTIGSFTGRERVLILRDGSSSRISAAPEDELWKALGRGAL